MAQQVLQTLEGLKMVEKDQGGGHKLTPRDREIWTKWLDRWQLPTRSIRTNDVGSINCLIRVTKKKKLMWIGLPVTTKQSQLLT